MRLLEDKRPGQKFALDVGRGQFDIKVDAANRPPSAMEGAYGNQERHPGRFVGGA